MSLETDKPATQSSPKPRTGGYGYSSRPGGPSSGPYKGRSPMGSPMGGKGGRPAPRRKVCRICMERTGGVDWKAMNFLRNFITERGKMLAARTTGTCSRCQRQLSKAIKRARTMALLPTSPF
jgi:small subunit ribosomal protein S18